MAEVGNLLFTMSADMKLIQGQLRTLENSFQGSFNKIQNQAKQLGGQLLNSFGIGLGVGGLLAFANRVADVGDQLSDLADATGLSVETLGGLKPVLEANGASLDNFAKSILRAQRSLGDIGSSGKEAAEGLKAVGLDAREMVNLSPDQFLERLVEALAKVPNANERAAIAFRVLGKQGQDLLPTILNLAENGIPKLDKATADAYRTLGQFKDQLAFVSAGLVNFAAVLIEPYVRLGQFTTALLGLRQLSQEEQFGKLARDIEIFSGNVARATGLAVGKIEGMSDDALNEMAKTADVATRVAIDKLTKARQAFDKIKLPSPAVDPAQGLLDKADDSKAKALKAALDGYRDSLVRTITQEELRRIEMTLGADAALRASQAFDVLALRSRLASSQLPIPADLQRAAKDAESTLTALGVNIDVLSERSLANLQQRVLAGASSLDQLKQSLDATSAAVQAFADAANEGVGLQFLTKEDVARIANAKRELDDLRTSLGLGAMDVSTPEGREKKRLAEIHVEFAATAARIEELGRAAGLSQEQIAEDVRLAWKKALADIGAQADEASVFWTRAIESVQDAVAGGINDILQGNIRSWEDWGNNIKRVIDGVVSQFLAAQLNAAVFGPQAGQGQGQIGGLIGKLLGFAGLFGGGGGDVFAGGATGYEAGFYHEGGAVQKASMAAFVKGSGLKNDEVPVVLQAGEFVINKDSAMRFGAPNLEKINRLHTGGLVATRFDTGVMNRIGASPGNAVTSSAIADAVRNRGSAGGDTVNITQNFPNATDYDSFRRSKANMLADLARAVERGRSHT